MIRMCYGCKNLFATEDCHIPGNALFNFVGIALNEPVICPDCWVEADLEKYYGAEKEADNGNDI